MTKMRASKGSRTSKIYLDPETDILHPLVMHRYRGRKKIIPFGWYGGKFSHLNWLLPLLPRCRQYCEPFGGSAAVLLNRRPSLVETYNDIDGNLVRFFRVLRDQRKELIDALILTPCSREELFVAAVGSTKGLSDLELARRFYIRTVQSFAANGHLATLGRWSYNISSSRRLMSKLNSNWLGGVASLPQVAQRLLKVQIEDRPALDVLRVYDDPNTLFYCDPPYLPDTRVAKKVYAVEMSVDQYREFADAVNSCKAKVAISGYDHSSMDKMFPAKRWFKTVGAEKVIRSSTKQAKRQEVLWTNYKLPRSRMFV